MPKYTITVTCSQEFILNTDEYLEDFKDEEVDPTDTDQLHDWIRARLEDDIAAFDMTMVDEIKLKPA